MLNLTYNPKPLPQGRGFVFGELPHHLMPVRKHIVCEALRKHGEAEAVSIVRLMVRILGLPVTADATAKLPKSDQRKVTVAALLRDRTNVGNSWVARRMAMGHSDSVSRMIGSCRKGGQLASTMKRLAKTLDET